jgi:hypothetical protein
MIKLEKFSLDVKQQLLGHSLHLLVLYHLQNIMTSYVHKMCEWTYGQTNMKRAITLAKFNHPWNRYNMHMLRSWPSMRILYRFHGWLIFARVIALFMFVWPYVRSHILCTQLVICLLSHFIHITLAKINHPWNRYNMHMLRSWSTKIPNINKMWQKTND